MDPRDIHQTNFCNQRVDNIVSNELKQYILQDIQTRTGLNFNSRYAKIFNEQYKQNLNNPHIACFKTSGSPYLLFLTQINHINYSLLIDKKINTGHSLPKMFVVHLQFETSLYSGTLFETELIRDKSNQWQLMLGDIYYYKNEKYQKKVRVIDRIQTIHDVLEKQFTESDKDICPLYVKFYFEIEDLETMYQTYSQTLNYNLRGFYFVPLNVNYSNILYLIQKGDTFNQTQSKKTVNFKLVKHSKPEIYELYLRNDDGYEKIDYAYIPTIDCSRKVHSLFQESEADIVMRCIYFKRFQKWTPIEKTTQMIDHVKDFRFVKT